MSKKLLCVDMDGTLLCDDKSVSKKNYDAIGRMLKEGHYFAFSTGRALQSGLSVAKKVGLDSAGCYISAYNGALLYDCAAERTLRKDCLSFDVVRELFARAEAAGIYAQTYSQTDVVTVRHTPELDYYRKNTGMGYVISENIMDALKEEPQKLILISLGDKEKLERFREENRSLEEGCCASMFSCDEYLEYCPIGADKGSGVQYLAECLGVPMENTIAVGDEENDLSMIRKAAVGVAMKNGIPRVKEMADYITEHDNNHDAIAEVIERFIL